MNVLERFSLAGKTVVVSGASSGIGQAMAKALAEAGADIITLSRSAQADEETALIINKAGRSYTHYDTDFSNRQSLYDSIRQIKENFSAIDILVNNAGTIMRKPIAEHPDEFWDEVIEVNLNSQFIITRELGKGMVSRGSGKIIFTCSLLTFQGGITVPGYAASKAGIGRLVMSFANEWASKGVNVNGIAPGYIATPITKALREDQERSKSILERIPAGRWGSPDDFAGPVVFLASAASEYLHGSIVTVDGGWMGR
jgi:2-deoxy-D-gluconate 3-dehydrogenase